MESEDISLEKHEVLETFNEAHHYSLSLCWKIQKGLSNGVSLKRIKKYADWYFDNYLNSFFEYEEKYLFPVAGSNHKLVKKVLSEHRRLRRLFKDKNNIERALHNIEEELERNIRLKEREVYTLVLEKATEDDLEKIFNLQRKINFVENTEDEFWEEK